MASFDAKFHWSLELEEKLIMFVMDYPCIFYPKVVEYRNAEVKANAFVKISKAVGCDPSEDKLKWAKIKDKFVRERNVNNKSSGSSSSDQTSKWPLFECMRFYDKHIQRRRRSGNMNSSFGRKHVESGDEDGDSQVSENEKENAATNVLNKC
uniref:MADF domain-containing protein n=1 Tax=Daphnia galeata TaxID=27404 RepID=A0A8J2RZI1_9CRUS|nr:unnamed protein product [Daphnia galeata]